MVIKMLAMVTKMLAGVGRLLVVGLFVVSAVRMLLRSHTEADIIGAAILLASGYGLWRWLGPRTAKAQ